MADSFFQEDPQENPSGEIPSLDENPSADSGDDKTGSGPVHEQDRRMAAVLAYLPGLCFVPLLSMKDDPSARFHARQGVILFLIEVVAVLFLIDVVSDFVFKAILVLAIASAVAGIYFAFQGKNYKLPIIGDLADKAKL